MRRSVATPPGRSRVLRPEEERLLVTAARAGDRHARDRLIESHLRLVVRMAMAYVGNGVDIADLVAEGNVGLIQGVDNFDPALGLRLNSYVRQFVKKSIREAIAKIPMLRVPEQARGLMREVEALANSPDVPGRRGAVPRGSRRGDGSVSPAIPEFGTGDPRRSTEAASRRRLFGGRFRFRRGIPVVAGSAPI